MDFRIHVALPDDAPLALLQVSGPPRAVKVVHGDEAVLNIRSRAHLKRASHEDADFAAPHFGEQLLLFRFRVGVVDERNLIRRYASCDKFVADVLVDGKGRVRLHACQKIAQRVNLRTARRSVSAASGGSVPRGGGFSFRRGQIAENDLGQPVLLPFPPDADDVAHAHIDLAFGVVGKIGIDKTLVKSQLAPVVRYL